VGFSFKSLTIIGLLLLQVMFLSSFTDCSKIPTAVGAASTALKSVPVYTYKIMNTYVHDHRGFTQGLVFEDGFLYEGTGLHAQSSLRRVALETGEILQLHRLPSHFFGEGITVYQDKIIQLTWKSNTGFVYRKDNFEMLREFNYSTEGWGITYDGQQLIMSDGTSTLYFLNPETFEEVRLIKVYDSNGPVKHLNELEYVEKQIYANVWQSNRIAKIDPQTGQVVGWIDLTGLLKLEGYRLPVDVLNGIAYDQTKKRLFVTGKLWPKLFEIQLIPVPESKKP
jgi:glutamine cyclotransferase